MKEQKAKGTKNVFPISKSPQYTEFLLGLLGTKAALLVEPLRVACTILDSAWLQGVSYGLEGRGGQDSSAPISADLFRFQGRVH